MAVVNRAASLLFKAKDAAIGYSALGVLKLLRLLPADKAVDLAGRTARRLGPLAGRHRVAVDNLRHAFPEKSDAEIQAIALGMWENMARLAAEYVYLDQFFDYDIARGSGDRIEVQGKEIFKRLAAEKGKAHILFTAHTGNFELLPVAAAELGIEMSALFRPPNNPYIARFIAGRRGAAMGGLVASRRGAAFVLSRILGDGGNVGMLVDQKFTNGVPTTFFGRPCESSPLLARLVRNFECDVYPARSIRLPGNRYKLVIEDRIELPRGADGRVDVERSTQMLNDIVERWVREYPEQWMWFHKRWKLTPRSAP